MLPLDSRPWPRFATVMAWWIIGIGALVRLAVFFDFRSFWTDEALLALNLTHRGFIGLTQPLDNMQVAPIGFLWAQRLMLLVFGNHDWSFRIVPLLAGLGLLPVTYFTARRLFAPVAALLALALVALSPGLIYYAAELKPYGSDAAITVALLWLCLRWLEQPSNGRLLTLGVAGLVAMWFSFTSIFTLAAIGVMVIGRLFRNRDRFTGPIIMLAAWGANFAGLWRIALRTSQEQRDYLLLFWRDGFAPVPRSLAALCWYPYALHGLIADPLYLWPGWLIAAMLLLGVVALWAHCRAFVLLVLPLLFALAASVAKRYPFESRLALFAAPLFFLILAAAVDWISRSRWRGLRCSAAGIAFAIVIAGAIRYRTLPWPPRAEYKPALAYIAAHRQANDHFCAYVYAGAPLQYYSPDYGLPATWQLLPDTDPTDAAIGASVDKLRGMGRTWVVLGHAYHFNEHADLTDHYLSALHRDGQMLDELDAPGVRVLLIDFK